MNIGDLFYTFRGNGAQLEKDAKVEGDKAGTALGTSMSAKIKASLSGGIGKGLIQGLGAGIGFGLFQEATARVESAISGIVEAGLKGEASIAKLGTSLKANIPGWDGNTAAIEKVITAQTNLGFSDDEQRDSLAHLVAATHDVNKALAIQRTAMDLARFKGISLSDATDALTKVEAGSYRILKSLGIELKKGATQTEALAAVQKIATGQAEDYANTTEGKLLVAQTKVGEAMEHLGLIILPLVGDAATTLATDVETLTGVLDVLSGKSKLTAAEQTDLSTSLLKMAASLPFVGAGFAPVVKALDDASAGAKQTAADTQTFADRVTGDFARIGSDVPPSLGKADDAVVDFRKKFHDAASDVVISANKIITQLAKDVQGLIDGYFNPVEERWALHVSRVQLDTDKLALANAKTKEEQRAATAAIISDLDTEATHLATLGDQHKLTQQDIDNFVRDAKKAYGKIPPEVQKIIDKMEVLAGLHPKVVITVDAKLSPAAKAALQKITHHAAGTGPLQFADGGYRPPGVASWVGEHGPELSVPTTGALIIPHVPSMALAGAGSSVGGGSTINVNLLDRMPVTNVRDIGDGLRMLERQGYLRTNRSPVPSRRG